MKHSRREFLAATAAAGAGLAFGRRVLAAEPFRTTLHKAVIGGLPNADSLRRLKDSGFEGIECRAWKVKPAEAVAAHQAAESLDMRVHSVLRGWVNFNRDSAARDIESVKVALRAAQAYGADAVLLVPARIGARAPQPWEFDPEFYEKTGHLTRVAAGEGDPYAEYIKAHNHATDTSRQALTQLIPTAAQTGVIIAVENVWNNLWVKPALFANFVASFRSRWIQAYFDIGNHVKYAPPQEWIRALGPMIVKCHVKDFKLKPDGRGGNFCRLREGSVDWPAVRRELDAVGYGGWLTNESGGLKLAELSRRFDLIIAGE